MLRSSNSEKNISYVFLSFVPVVLFGFVGLAFLGCPLFLPRFVSAARNGQWVDDHDQEDQKQDQEDQDQEGTHVFSKSYSHDLSPEG